MAESTGTKRPHSDSTSDAQPLKKRKVRRTLHHVQKKPQHVEPASQDPVFIQGQLLRNISAALVNVGFDSVKPTALEMFRSSAEEYMLKFLHYARTSMSTSRRTQPTALDFASALALMPNTSSASLLKPQLSLSLPEEISYPSIPEPDPEAPSPPDFSSLLQPLVTDNPPTYIPKHFPSLPPQHAWKRTPVFPERENDARRMRERATEEGILAEQALRKLAAAAKKGAVKAEIRREGTLSGPGRKREAGRANRKRKERDEDGGEVMFGAMMKESGGEGLGGSGAQSEAEADAMELSLHEAAEMREEGVDVGMPEGVVVNWDMSGWRRGGRKGLRV